MIKKLFTIGAVASAVMVAGCNEDEPTRKARPAATPQAAAETSKPAPAPVASSSGTESNTPQIKENFLFVINDIPVSRPDGRDFTVDALAYCAQIADQYDAGNAAETRDYKEACTRIVTGKYNYFACDRENFVASTATNNKTLRARGWNMKESEIKDSYLLLESQIRNIAAMGYNTSTVMNISNVENALPYDGFKPGQDCRKFLLK